MRKAFAVSAVVAGYSLLAAPSAVASPPHVGSPPGTRGYEAGGVGAEPDHVDNGVDAAGNGERLGRHRDADPIQAPRRSSRDDSKEHRMRKPGGYPRVRFTLALTLALLALGASQTSSALAGSSTSSASANGRGVPPNRPDQGLVYDGLVRATTGPCAGAFQIVGTSLCTHGPDAPPKGFDVKRPVPPVTAPATPAIQCDGDGVSGKRVQVVYARASDVTDRYDTYLASFQQWAADADAIYSNSALETGGTRHIRFVHDANCVVTVAHVVMSSTGDDTFGNTIAELKAVGLNSTSRKYMVFVDAFVYCGIGNILGDDQVGSANVNNGGPSYGRADSWCWEGETPAHELMHNIGGVQLSAPHSSGAFHCYDEWDLECYDDGGSYFTNGGTLQYLCPYAHDLFFDCNHDDYYNTTPPSGGYLATHWDAPNSEYLIAGPQAKWGYAWANEPSNPSYTPSTLYQFNSKGLTNTITRSGVGDYTVHFPGLAANAGTVNVTAQGSSTTNYCQVESWFGFVNEEQVHVRCFTTASVLADTPFTASFTMAGSAGPLAYVWADQPTNPSYTPSASYQYNSTVVNNTITRSGMGTYQVHLPGLGALAGTVLVTAYGSGSTHCKVVSWGPVVAEQRVNVQCYAGGGFAVDSKFTMTYSRSLGFTGILNAKAAYVWANQPSSPSYTPSTNYQYNSTWVTNTITRSAVGVYAVKLPGLGGSFSGDAQVTAYGAGSNWCKVSGWGPSGTDEIVTVRCYTTFGVAADTMFTMTFLR